MITIEQAELYAKNSNRLFETHLKKLFVEKFKQLKNNGKIDDSEYVEKFKQLKNSEKIDSSEEELEAASLYTESAFEHLKNINNKDEKTIKTFFERYLTFLKSKAGPAQTFGWLWEYACVVMLSIKNLMPEDFKKSNDPNFDIKFKNGYIQCKSSYISKPSLEKFKAGTTGNKTIGVSWKDYDANSVMYDERLIKNLLFYYCVFIGMSSQIGMYYCGLKEYFDDIAKLKKKPEKSKFFIGDIKKNIINQRNLQEATGDKILFTIKDINEYFSKDIEKFLIENEQLKNKHKIISTSLVQDEASKFLIDVENRMQHIANNSYIIRVPAKDVEKFNKCINNEYKETTSKEEYRKLVNKTAEKMKEFLTSNNNKLKEYFRRNKKSSVETTKYFNY